VEAREFLERCLVWFRSHPSAKSPDGRAAASDALNKGECLYARDEWNAAQAQYAQIVTRWPHLIGHVARARQRLLMLAARRGDSVSMMDNTQAVRALDTSWYGGQGHWIVEAKLAALHGDRAGAFELIQNADGFDFFPLHWDVDFRALWDYPRFVALLAKR
jgi:hypothetical protein